MAIKVSNITVVDNTRGLNNITALDATTISTIEDNISSGIAYTRHTANVTAAANQGIIADTSGGTFTVTLPALPATGDTVVITDGADWSTNNLTVARNGSTIEGDAENLTMDIGGVAVQFTYDGLTWQIYTQLGAGVPQVELTQAQVEDDTSTVFGQVSGQRLGQSIAALAGGGLVPITQAVAAGDTTIEFTALDSSLYDHYLFIYSGVIPTSDGGVLRMRIKEDGAGSFATTEYLTTGTTSEVRLGAAIGSATGEYGVSGFTVMTSPHRTDVPTGFVGLTQYENNTGNASSFTVAGNRTNLNATIEVQFDCLTGTMEVGTITMYGISKV